MFDRRSTVSGGAEDLSRAAHLPVFLWLLAICCTAAHAAPGRSAPLLDRALFLAEPEISGARISPDGKLLAFLKPFHGVQNVWIKRAYEPLTSARPVTAGGDHSAVALYWSNDSRYLLFTRDSGGNGKSDLFAVRADGPTLSADKPKVRNLRLQRPHRSPHN